MWAEMKRPKSGGKCEWKARGQRAASYSTRTRDGLTCPVTPPPGLWAPEALVGRSPERPLFFLSFSILFKFF